MLLGCIADDLTGATDLGVNLARAGLSVVQINGVPGELDLPATDAVVVALKSRTITAGDATAQSLAALEWLRRRGAERIYFKYCSTFDSTPLGNIGPVTEALQKALGGGIAASTPAYPRNGRTVYQGHLFVGDVLLSETGMRQHPLTPMTDANLVRVLAAQCVRSVGLVGVADLEAGAAGTREKLGRLQSAGHGHAIVDATRDEHLIVAAEAVLDLPLCAGSAGLGFGLALRLASRALPSACAWKLPTATGPVAWLAGSCSKTTLGQVAAVRDRVASFQIDPFELAADDGAAERTAQRAVNALGAEPVLVFASAAPAAVSAAQSELGVERAAELVEGAFRKIAVALLEAGTRRFVVAGGETSGAVVDALGVRALVFGPEIDLGVPWTLAVGGEPIWLALKSGNFGGRDFFAKATGMLR